MFFHNKAKNYIYMFYNFSKVKSEVKMTVQNSTAEVFNNIQPTYTAPPVTPAKTTVTTVADALPAAQVATEKDTVELSSKTKPEKKGFVKTVNHAISNFKKFFATLGAYTVAGAKGFGKALAFGSIATVASIGIDAIANKKIAHPKIAACVGAFTAVATFATTVWKASLDLNEKKSDIEHRYEGHKQ